MNIETLVCGVKIMKINLKEWIKNNPDKIQSVGDYSTLNAWGFDGSYGKQYVLTDGKTCVRIGKFSTRHQGTFPTQRVVELLGKPEDAGNYRSIPPDEFQKNWC